MRIRRSSQPGTHPPTAHRCGLDLLAHESGQSALEFAVVLPVLLMVLFGLATFGVAMNNYVAIAQATTLAVHQVAIDRNGTSDPCTVASSAVYATVPTLKQSSLNFTLVIGGNSYTGTSCSGATNLMVQGQPAQFTVTYPCSVWTYGLKFPTCVITGNAQELIQ